MPPFLFHRRESAIPDNIPIIVLVGCSFGRKAEHLGVRSKAQHCLQIRSIYILLTVCEQIVQQNSLCRRKTHHILQMPFSSLLQRKIQLLEGPHQILFQIQPSFRAFVLVQIVRALTTRLSSIIRFSG